MKVNGSPNPHQRTEAAKERQEQLAEELKERREGTPRNDGVQVSDVARALTAARSPETPDSDRIERLRAEIENGTFQIDAEAIAEAMLKEEV